MLYGLASILSYKVPSAKIRIHSVIRSNRFPHPTAPKIHIDSVIGRNKVPHPIPPKINFDKTNAYNKLIATSTNTKAGRTSLYLISSRQIRLDIYSPIMQTIRPLHLKNMLICNAASVEESLQIIEFSRFIKSINYLVVDDVVVTDNDLSKISKVDRLLRLVISNSIFTSFSPNITWQSSLTHIMIYGTNLHDIDLLNLDQCHNLEYLDLSHNMISKISFNSISNVKTLLLSYNMLTDIDDIVLNPMKKLQTLALDDNDIRRLPTSIFDTNKMLGILRLPDTRVVKQVYNMYNATTLILIGYDNHGIMSATIHHSKSPD